VKSVQAQMDVKPAQSQTDVKPMLPQMDAKPTHIKLELIKLQVVLLHNASYYTIAQRTQPNSHL
jgi:hypothetical protein